jgi:hypothetical protein
MWVFMGRGIDVIIQRFMLLSSCAFYILQGLIIVYIRHEKEHRKWAREIAYSGHESGASHICLYFTG